jgi:hypothetical protein
VRDVTKLKSHFAANSANDQHFPEFWVEAAAVFPEQLRQLAQFGGHPAAKQLGLAEIGVLATTDPDELKEFFCKYGSDKSIAAFHNYHILYAYLMDRLGRNSSLRYLEIGIGTDDPTVASSMGTTGKPGASLRSFRDYCPNAQIFGADIDRKCLFTEERIQTFYVDQLDTSSFAALYASCGGEDFDFILDDGLHSICANLNTLLWGLGHLKKGGFLCVEDIGGWGGPGLIKNFEVSEPEVAEGVPPGAHKPACVALYNYSLRYSCNRAPSPDRWWTRCYEAMRTSTPG